jgi:hypothetical protein
VGRAEERRLEERRDEAVAAQLGPAGPFQHVLLALDGAYRAGVVGPVVLPLTIGRRGHLLEVGTAVRNETHGRVVSRIDIDHINRRPSSHAAADRWSELVLKAPEDSIELLTAATRTVIFSKFA